MHKLTPITTKQPLTSMDCPRMSKNLHNSVPCFGTDQPPISGIFSYQACILNAKFPELKTQQSTNILGSHSHPRKIPKISTSSVPCFGTDQTAPHGLKLTETSKKHLNGSKNSSREKILPLGVVKNSQTRGLRVACSA